MTESSEDEQQLTNINEDDSSVHSQSGISKKFILLITCLCALCDCLLLSVIVPIIPVYLNVDKPTTGSQTAGNSTNNSLASGSTPTISDPSMDFKIGLLFASKAFVQIVVNPFTGYLTESVWLCR